MQKLILIITTLIITSFNSMAQNDGIDVISVAIKSGNAKEISKHFDSSISLKILNKEDVYSKAQAEIIIKDFIMKNPIKNYTLGNFYLQWSNFFHFFSGIGTGETQKLKKRRIICLFSRRNAVNLQ